jgi:hypothetical protein
MKFIFYQNMNFIERLGSLSTHHLRNLAAKQVEKEHFKHVKIYVNKYNRHFCLNVISFGISVVCPRPQHLTQCPQFYENF